MSASLPKWSGLPVLGAASLMFAALTGHSLADEPKLTGTLVCVGDSITEGQPKERVGDGNDYVSLLRKKTADAKLDLKVVNEGRSGWSTQSYLENAEGVVKAMPEDATVITVMLGTNDTRADSEPNAIAKQAVTNLRKLIGLYHEKAPKAKFVLMSAPAIYPKKLSQDLRNANYNEASVPKIAALKRAYAKMAADDHLQFVDLSNLPSKDHSLEGVHPGAEGQKELADKIWEALIKGR